MNKLILGDSMEEMKMMETNSMDCGITDPPYGLTSMVKRFGKQGSAPAKFGTDGRFSRASKGFMGKTWDGTGIEADVKFWEEFYRVLKPGAFLLAFSGTRTYHRMASAIEDAGFEIHDMFEWVYGQGFPKSHNISKYLKKMPGMEMEAKQWDGWGTQLKPSHEPICLAQKPISEKTIAKNVLKWGTGAMNIEACKIGYKGDNDRSGWHKTGADGSKGYLNTNTFKIRPITKEEIQKNTSKGRWPANLIHDGSEEVLEIFPESHGWHGKPGEREIKPSNVNVGGGQINCVYNDEGSAARFFYCAKASKSERDAGCEAFPEQKAAAMNERCINCGKERLDGKRKGACCDNPEYENVPPTAGNRNNHPSVKPVTLMKYLITLVTPPGGTVFDPFMGSGSTGVAAKKLGFSFVGIDKEKEYYNTAKARIDSTTYEEVT